MSPLNQLSTATRRMIAGLVTTLVVVLGFGAVAFAPSDDSGQRKPDAPKPTIVLVHGGWDNSSGWNAVIEKLQRRGYLVIAPANPLRSLASDSAYVSSVLDTIQGPVVLVGHSYGGSVVTNTAVGHAHVKGPGYNAAFSA